MSDPAAMAIRRIDSSTGDDVGIAESKVVSVLADHFNYLNRNLRLASMLYDLARSDSAYPW